MANIWGAVFVSTGINFLSLRGWFGSYDHAVFGVILIAIMSVSPQGPLALLGPWWNRISRKWMARADDERAVA
jgi:branched-chain amino acid transport system permease protein